MRSQPALRAADVAALRRAFTRSGSKKDKERMAAWRSLAERQFRSAHALIAYHDLLLFALAYPRTVLERGFAQQELLRVVAIAERMTRGGPTHRHALMNSGIAGTVSRAAFGIDLVRWAVQLPQVRLSLDGLGGDADLVRLILLAVGVPAEREAIDDARRSQADRVRWMFGRDRIEALRDLVRAIDGSSDAWPLRHAVWETLRPTLLLDAARSGLTRTFARAPYASEHLFAIGAWPEDAPVRLGPMRPIPLNAAQCASLLLVSRGVLIGHLRETDTATCCLPHDIEAMDMGEGISVVLLPLPAGRRTLIDVYVGFVAFSNGVPVAYGGAWIFPGKSKIGVNVFPSFRGGPSALVFARIIRCYAQRYGVGLFEAEDHQLGHHNADGIRSGAYWFYYRLGFRTVDPALASVAAQEHGRIIRDRTYRTTHEVLRCLVAQPMRLSIREEPGPLFEPIDLSEAVLRHLATCTGGDRLRASAGCVRRMARVLNARDRASWPLGERASFEELAPAVDLIPNIEGWSARELRGVLAILRAKGARTEDRYLTLLRGHPRLLEAWATAAASI